MSQAAILIIGNEILSGRTQDTNTRYIAQKLCQKGIYICEVRIVQDGEQQIIDALNALRVIADFVFTTGGIGTTHDDITIATVAKALNRPLILHQQATEIIAKYYPHVDYQAYFPEGAQLIFNSVTHAPSFFVDNVYVLAGMPKIMHAMLDDVLPKLPQYPIQAVHNIHALVNEHAIAHDMSKIQKVYKDISIGSYPIFEDNHASVNLVIQGYDSKRTQQAVDALISMLKTYTNEIQCL